MDELGGVFRCGDGRGCYEVVVGWRRKVSVSLLEAGAERESRNRLRTSLCGQGDWVGWQGKRLPQDAGLSLKEVVDL